MADLDRTLISNEKDRKRFKAMLAEITNCLARMDSERDQMKEIAEAGEDEFGIKKKLINKIARTMYKHNYSDLQAENEHFEYLYESVVEGKKDTDEAA